MGVNSLPKTVTRQRRDSDLNPGPSAPESSTLSTRLPSHPVKRQSTGMVVVSFSLRRVRSPTISTRVISGVDRADRRV